MTYTFKEGIKKEITTLKFNFLKPISKVNQKALVAKHFWWQYGKQYNSKIIEKPDHNLCC